jgi:uncharacterized membrane protein
MATQQRVAPQQLANGLGWFSIGLGLAEMATPNLVANLIGVTNDSKTRKVLRFYGARELAAGLGILSQSKPSGWLWARVAGDVVDISSLCKAMTEDDNDRGKGIATAAALIGVTLADVYCAKQLSNGAGSGTSRTTATSSIASSIIIARDRNEIYGFWRDFTRLPEIFDRLESVRTYGDGRRSHWKLAMPMGRNLEWDAEITDDQPNSRIAWRSISSSAPHSGEVRFEPAAGNRGTKVYVEVRPEGLGTSLGKLFGLVPNQHVNIALHNLKQLLEVGEVAKSDASIHRGMHPARPPQHYIAGGGGMRNAASV